MAAVRRLWLVVESRAAPRTFASVVPAGGTPTGWSTSSEAFASSTATFWGVARERGDVWSIGTLLGPEGTGPRWLEGRPPGWWVVLLPRLLVSLYVLNRFWRLLGWSGHGSLSCAARFENSHLRGREHLCIR